MQANVEDTSVAPVIVATIVCDCVGTMTDVVPVTVTTTTLAVLLLPHPLPQRPAKTIASRMILTLLCRFIPTVSPTFARFASVPRFRIPKSFRKSQSSSHPRMSG